MPKNFRYFIPYMLLAFFIAFSLAATAGAFFFPRPDKTVVHKQELGNTDLADLAMKAVSDEAGRETLSVRKQVVVRQEEKDNQAVVLVKVWVVGVKNPILIEVKFTKGLYQIAGFRPVS